MLLQALLHLHLVPAMPFASGLLTTWQQAPQHYPATIGRLITWTRRYLNPWAMPVHPSRREPSAC